MDSVSHDTNKIDILTHLAWNLRLSFPDSALQFAENAIGIADTYQNLEAKAKLYRVLGSIHWNKGNYFEAKLQYTKGITLYDSFINSPDSIIQTMGYLGRGKCKNGLGLILYHLGDYTEAINSYLEAVKDFEKIGESYGIANCYNNIGLVHWKQENNGRALDYYKQSKEIYINIKHTAGLINIYNNIAIIRKQNKEYEEAIRNYNTALAIAQKTMNNYAVAICYNNLGILYGELEEYNKALKYYIRSFDIRKKQGNKDAMASTLNNTAELYNIFAKNENNTQRKLNYYQKALDDAKTGLSFATESGSLPRQLELQHTLSVSYEGVGNFQQSLLHIKQYIALKDSLFTLEKNKQIEESEAKFQAERKELHIENLEKENNLKSLKLEKLRLRQFLFYGIFFLSVFIIITLLILRKRMRDKNKTIVEQNKTIGAQLEKIIFQNEEITTQKEELENHRNHLESLVDERTKELVKAKEKAEDSDRLKSAFFANMSHEIRTPMNAIVGFSELLLTKKYDDDKKNSIISNISENCDSLISLIDDIINAAKIDSDQLELHIEAFTIKDLINEATEIYTVKFKHHIQNTLEFSLKCDINDQTKIISDKMRILHVYYILIDNAFKFTESGSVSVEFKTKGNNFFLTVKDTGIGMTPEQQNRIFACFTKLENERKKLYRGAGLGLFICKGIIEKMGGHIHVVSEEHKGSSFVVNFPLK